MILRKSFAPCSGLCSSLSRLCMLWVLFCLFLDSSWWGLILSTRRREKVRVSHSTGQLNLVLLIVLKNTNIILELFLAVAIYIYMYMLIIYDSDCATCACYYWFCMNKVSLMTCYFFLPFHLQNDCAQRSCGLIAMQHDMWVNTLLYTH